MKERRKAIRRTADKELLRTVEELRQRVDRRGGGSKSEAERKRRRIIRHDCKVGLKMVLRHAPGTSDQWETDTVRVKGRLLDLSGDGAALLTKQMFMTGHELILAIKLRDGSEINTNGVVRWVKSVPEKDAFASGVQFGEVVQKDRKKLTRFLSELDATVGL